MKKIQKEKEINRMEKKKNEENEKSRMKKMNFRDRVNVNLHRGFAFNITLSP